jgi:hypothetical protein
MGASDPLVTDASDVLESAEAAQAAWMSYYDFHKPSGVNGTEAFAEASTRLRLMGICLDRVLEIHERFKVQWDPNKDFGLENTNLLFGPLWLDTESFYWQCGRFRNLARMLPGLKSFEAPGIRDVRNHLIEHPESKASGVTINSFGWHPERGPTIKSCRTVETVGVFPDAGLLANAKNFYEELSRKLTVALRAAQSAAPL